MPSSFRGIIFQLDLFEWEWFACGLAFFYELSFGVVWLAKRNDEGFLAAASIMFALACSFDRKATIEVFCDLTQT